MDLTAREAAARLGIKRATLYAYVSRGIVSRTMAPDGRTSMFSSDEIAALRTGRHQSRVGELATLITSSVTSISDDELLVAGRDLTSVIDEPYESVADHLWADDGAWDIDVTLAKFVLRVSEALPPQATGTDRLRAITATASSLDPLRYDLSRRGVANSGRRLLLAMATGLAASDLDRRPAPTVSPSGSQIASLVWLGLAGDAPRAHEYRALNAALVLLIDHGLATSTFGARVAASVRGDIYSVVTAGLGVVGGTLHGGASRDVHLLLANAFLEGDPSVALGESLRRTGAIPGAGHVVYQTRDPRYEALMATIEAGWAEDPRLATVHSMHQFILNETDMPANVDAALGALTWLAEMEPTAGEAIFSVARTAGWIAHGLEEYGEEPLRFRPRAKYIARNG